MMFSDFPSISSLGVALAVIGAAIVALVILVRLITRSHPLPSMLAPTLGFDALDFDLQQRYRDSLELAPEHPEIGREVRRSLFVIQAHRFSQQQSVSDDLKALDQLMEAGIDLAQISTFRTTLQAKRRQNSAT